MLIDSESIRPVFAQAARCRRGSWQARYGRRHGFIRLTGDPDLPNGRRGRVTIYRRGEPADHAESQTFILSWCCAGRRHKERVRGDKFDAVRRADEINRMVTSGVPTAGRPRLHVRELKAAYLDHLNRRAEAGEISPGTPRRYRSALAHLTAFVTQRSADKKNVCWVPTPDFGLQFKAYLRGAMISPNGHRNTSRRLLSAKGVDFILAGVRAMVRWAVQEGLLPPESTTAFSNPGRDRKLPDPLAQAPVTTDEVIRLVHSMDRYQLGMFSFHLFHGVRVAEPCWLMIEFFDPNDAWIEYRCIDEFAYRTKGRNDKRLPMPAVMAKLVVRMIGDRSGGSLLLRRGHVQGRGGPVDQPTSLASIVQAVRDEAPSGWANRAHVARALLRAAGMINGDDVRREFARLHRRAALGRNVTPKALRHHFATALERADVPYYTRKYLLGHRLTAHPARRGDATAVYTHLDADAIKAAYQRLLDGPLASVLKAFEVRVAEVDSPKHPTSADRCNPNCDHS